MWRCLFDFAGVSCVSPMQHQKAVFYNMFVHPATKSLNISIIKKDILQPSTDYKANAQAPHVAPFHEKPD